MHAYWTLVRRELSGYFLSWIGYVVMAAVLWLIGLSFVNLLEALNHEPSDLPVSELFYRTYYFWMILLLTAPLITMRSFALEKHTGTFETLMTTPVSDLQVVLAKFSGCWLFYVLMWLPLLGCILVVRHYTNDQSALDWGAVAATFVGILLVGALYISLGCFASTLTRSQVIAAVISFVLGVAFFALSYLSYSLKANTGWKAQVLSYVCMMDHMQAFARGAVDTRPVVCYLGLTVFFLYLTLKVVESRRWK